MISQIWPQSKLYGSAKQLGDLLVVAESSRPPQTVRELGPLSRSAAGMARPAATAHRVSDVLRLRAHRQVIRPNTAPDVAAVPHHRFRQRSIVRQCRPAMAGDHAERLTTEAAVAAIGLDPAESDPTLVTAAEIDARCEAGALVNIDEGPLRLKRPVAFGRVGHLATTLTEGCHNGPAVRGAGRSVRRFAEPGLAQLDLLDRVGDRHRAAALEPASPHGAVGCDPPGEGGVVDAAGRTSRSPTSWLATRY